MRLTDKQRQAIRGAISNAYYEAREAGETMEVAADRAVNAVLGELDVQEYHAHIAERWPHLAEPVEPRRRREAHRVSAHHAGSWAGG